MYHVISSLNEVSAGYTMGNHSLINSRYADVIIIVENEDDLR